MPVIRASALPGYADCARKAAVNLFRKEIEDAGFTLRKLIPGVGSVVGQAFHAAAAAFLTAARNREEPNIDDALSQGLDKLKVATAEGVEWDRTTPTIITAEEQVTRLIRGWQLHARTLYPKSIEHELQRNVGDGFDLSGHVDDYEASGLVLDHKTGTKPPKPQAQLGAYSLLLRANDESPNAVAADYINRKSGEIIRLDYDIDECERAAVCAINHIKTDYQKFYETNDPWSFQANPWSVLCGAKYCPAHGTAFCSMGK